MSNQILVMNGTFILHSNPDPISEAFYKRQLIALDAMPENLKTIPHYEIPLVPYNPTGLSHLRQLFHP